jgi:predicted SAM-dependent methyltransferase
MLIRLSYIFKYFSRIFYKGNNVECPVCERSFRKFLSYGSETAARDGVLCPYDLNLERHRLMWLYMTKMSDFFTSPKKVMHIAPEQCFHKKFQKQENLDYTTGDLMSPIADLHFDLHKIPLEDNQYDVVFCNHVMEHVEDDRQCMSELFRIMKPGGWGIMQVPQDLNAATTYEDPTITDPKEREKHFWQYDHVRLYGMDYPDRLKSVGFEVEVYDYRIEFSKEQSDRYRLHENEMLYVVRKPKA